MKSERFCTNCRAPLPAGAAWCEACGTDAGAVFDGPAPGQRSSRGVWWLIVLLVIAGGAAAAWTYRSKIPMLRPKPVFDTGPVRVVGQRPGGARRPAGAKLSEPEAVMTLRRELAKEVKSECLAVASRGYSNGAYAFDAVDSCSGTKLGRFKVDGVNGSVVR
ncbi:MAG TPA: zinc ribbon domain-containing protein [Thermoanaerobaculia bacterium]|nr:zinc ribbon domain-containing protein [Thermoanaerobaculia bacterium]